MENREPDFIAVFPDDPRLLEPGDSTYSVLIGPDGTEYWLGEPEDRTWMRDGAPVVELLNKQYNRILELEELLVETTEVLERLVNKVWN